MGWLANRRAWHRAHPGRWLTATEGLLLALLVGAGVWAVLIYGLARLLQD